MQVHENHYTKRAGVAGIRARAQAFTLRIEAIYSQKIVNSYNASTNYYFIQFILIINRGIYV